MVAAVALRIAGLAVPAHYALLQQRTMPCWYSAVTRAAALEPQLGFGPYSGRPPTGGFSTRNAMRAFFLLMALYRVATLVWHRCRRSRRFGWFTRPGPGSTPRWAPAVIAPTGRARPPSAPS
jgi:hypothetical protein